LLWYDPSLLAIFLFLHLEMGMLALCHFVLGVGNFVFDFTGFIDKKSLLWISEETLDLGF
jgi:hypothetical protein